MHANQQLQIRTRREVLARLHQPLEHVRKCIGWIVQLRIPRDVGQQANDRFRRVEPNLSADLLRILARRPVEHDPVEHPLAAAAEILHELAFLRRRQLEPVPVLARLVEQRVVIRVVVAEDEPPLPVRHVPVRHVHALLPRDLADDPPRHVDAVREDGGREPDGAHQAPRRKGGEQRRLEVPPENRLAQRLLVQRSGGKETERARMRMLADVQPFEREALDLIERQRGCDAPRLRALRGVDPVAHPVNLQTERLVDLLRRPGAVAAQVARRPVLRELLEVRVERRLAFRTRRHRPVAEQRVHFGAAERQRDGQRALERHRVRIRADGGGHQDARAALRRRARRFPELAIGRDGRGPVRIRVAPRVVPPPREP